MKKQAKEKRLWRFLCYAVILLGAFTAFHLSQRHEEERSQREHYIHVNEQTLYDGISDICYARSRMDVFFFSTDKCYKMYTGDYGSEAVYTNSHDLYSLYLQARQIYQYLSFDMVLKDPNHAHIYTKAAEPLARLRDLVIANPSEEEFKSHSDDFAEAIEAIEPLLEPLQAVLIGVREAQEAGLGRDAVDAIASVKAVRTIFERFAASN